MVLPLIAIAGLVFLAIFIVLLVSSIIIIKQLMPLIIILVIAWLAFRIFGRQKRR